MKKHASLVLILGALLVTACADETQTSAGIADFDSEVGWLHGNCFAIKNTDIADGTELTLMLLDEPKQRVAATVTHSVQTGDVCLPIKTGRTRVNLASGYSFYSVDADVDIELAIGIVGSSIPMDKYAFDYCTAEEGILYRLKSAEQGAGRDLWQGYYYLDSDADMTCDMPDRFAANL